MILSQNLVNTIAFSLLHSLWQIALIALLVFIINKIFAKKKASIRYLSSFAGLVFILFSFVATFALIDNNTQAQPLAINNETNLNLNPEIALEASSLSNEIAPVIIETVSIPQEIIERAPLSNFLKAKKLLLANLQYFVLFWLIGIAILSIRLLAQYIFAERYKYRHKNQANGKAQEIFLGLKAKLKITKKAKLFESSIAKIPMVIGVFKPVVILPVSALSGLSGDMLEHILAHELAHIKRHDYLFNLLQTVIETLFFYHPAVWWISKQARLERENACDDIAIRACGSAAEYAETLIRLEHIRQEPKVAMAATSNLKERIVRILNIKQGRKQNPSGYLLSLLILVTIVGFLASQIFSQNVLAQESVEFKAKALIGDYEFYWLYLNKSASFNDKQELVSLPEDGVLRLEQKLSEPERKLEVRNTDSGLLYEYFINNEKAEYNEQAKAWFLDAIKSSLYDLRSNKYRHELKPERRSGQSYDKNTSYTYSWSTRNIDKTFASGNRIGHTIFSFREDFIPFRFRLYNPYRRLPEERILLAQLSSLYYGLDYPDAMGRGRNVPSLADSINSFLKAYQITNDIKTLLTKIAHEIEQDDIRQQVLANINAKTIQDRPSALYVVPSNMIYARQNLFVRTFGNYAISKDAKLIKPTEAGAYIIIEEIDRVDSKKLILANHNGQIDMRYFVNDLESPISDDAYKWLHKVNKKFIEEILKEQVTDSNELIEKTINQAENDSNKSGVYRVNYFAQAITDDLVYEYLQLPSKTLKELIEDENATFFSLLNKQHQIFGLLNKEEYIPFVEQTLYEAIDYYPINERTLEMIFSHLNESGSEEIITKALVALVPKLPKDDPEIMREFNALVDTIQNQTLREQIQKRLAAKQ